MNEAFAESRLNLDQARAAASSSLKRAVAVLLVAVAALWPAILNGGPFWMPDTPSYFRAADSAGAEVFGIKTAWTAEYDRLYRTPVAAEAPTTAEPAAAPVRPAPDQAPVTLKGRSIYYGALLYGAYLLGSLWLVVLIQAALAALVITWTITALLRAGGKPVRDRTILLIGLGLAALTPLGFFASYLMPDIFGAFAILALLNLLFLREHHSRRIRGLLLVILAYAVLAHSTNLALAMLLLAAMAVLHLAVRKGPAPRAYLGVVACLAVGFGGQAAFDLAVERVTGAPPVRPPFIAMRLIADGPGLTHLRSHCTAEPYIYCRAKNLYRPHSDTLLWSLDPSKSLFRGLGPAEQRLSAAQETRFVTAVVKDQPVPVLVAFGADALAQFVRLDLREFSYFDSIRQRLATAVPAQLHEQIRSTRAYSQTMPLRFTEAATALTTVVSLTILLFTLARNRREPWLSGPRGAALFVILAVSLNAALCGALSGPNGRYQMRLIWVLPLVAAGVVAARPSTRPAVRP